MYFDLALFLCVKLARLDFVDFLDTLGFSILSALGDSPLSAAGGCVFPLSAAAVGFSPLPVGALGDSLLSAEGDGCVSSTVSKSRSS